MQTANHDRSWILNPLLLFAVLVLIGSFTLLNLYPRVRWGSINYYIVGEGEFSHGWPLVYMRRDSDDFSTGFRGHHSPWPFVGNSPVRYYRPSYLVVDVAAALLLMPLATWPIASFLRSHRIRFSLALLGVTLAAICAFLAVLRIVSLQYDLYVVGFLLLHLVPNSVVILSLASVCLLLARFVYGGDGCASR